MAVLHAAGAPLTTSGYTLLIADDPTQVAAAQRLRHEVFAGELGATLHARATAGLDIDDFDDALRPPDRPRGRTGEVVGTYRMLPPGPHRRPATPTASSTCPRWTRCATTWSRPAAPACTRTTAPAP